MQFYAQRQPQSMHKTQSSEPEGTSTKSSATYDKFSNGWSSITCRIDNQIVNHLKDKKSEEKIRIHIQSNCKSFERQEI